MRPTSCFKEVFRVCSSRSAWSIMFRSKIFKIFFYSVFLLYGLCLCLMLFLVTSVYPLINFNGYQVHLGCPKISIKDPNFYDTFYRDHIFQELPCVIEGGPIDDWVSYKEWSWDYLSAKVAPETSVVINYANKTNPYFGPTFSTTLRTNFSDFVRRVNDPNDYRMYYFNQQYNESGGAGIENFLAAHLAADYEVPFFMTKFYYAYQTNLWLGKGPLRSAPHYDGSENLLVQIRGSKLFRVYPPTQSEYLYSYSKSVCFFIE